MVELERVRLQFKAESINEQGKFTGFASIFGLLDSENDIVEPGAFKKTLSTGMAKNGVKILAQHNEHMLPLGKTQALKETDKGLYVEGYISPTSLGRDYRQLIKDGVLDEMSIGYIALQYYIDDKGVRHLTEVELVEISIVNFPANAGATIESYKGGQHHMAEVKDNKDTKQPKEAKEAPEKATEVKEITPEQLQTMLDQAAEAGAAAVLQQLQAQQEQETPPDDAAKEEAPEQEEKKEAKQAKETKQQPAQPVQRKYQDIYMNIGRQPEAKKTGLEPGIGWVRYQKSMMRAKGDPEIAAMIAKKQFGDDFMAREIKAAMASIPSDGGYLVPEVYATEIIPLLQAKAVIVKLGATVIPMDRGNINMPKQTSGSTAQYVGEARKAKTSKATFGNLRMSSKKLMTKHIISNDLIRSNSYQADKVILNDATTTMALGMDAGGLFGKGTDFEPLGIFSRNDVPTIAVNGAVSATLSGSMEAKLIQNNADTTKLGWAFNGHVWEKFYNVMDDNHTHYIYREQMDEGKVGRHEFAISNQIPNASSTHNPTKILLGNWSEMFIGRQGQMESLMSTEGTVTDDDGNIISALDHDVTILRIIDLHDFGVRHPESFAIATGVYTD